MDKKTIKTSTPKINMEECKVERVDILEDSIAPTWGIVCIGKNCTKKSFGIICG
jgi:hypothetical protein